MNPVYIVYNFFNSDLQVMLTDMIFEPLRVHVEWRTDVEDVWVSSEFQVRKTHFRTENNMQN